MLLGRARDASASRVAAARPLRLEKDRAPWEHSTGRHRQTATPI